MTTKQAEIDEFVGTIPNKHGRIEEQAGVVAFTAAVRHALIWVRGDYMRDDHFVYYSLVLHTFWAPTPMAVFHQEFGGRSWTDAVSDCHQLLQTCIESGWEGAHRAR